MCSWFLDFHNQGQISLLCQPLSQILKRYLFWDSIQHYSTSFNNLEIVICLVLIIYVFPWWKLRPHFPFEFFLIFHHSATMKTISQKKSHFKQLVIFNNWKNNYEPYLQLSNLCDNMCSCNLMVIMTNGLMEWMFNIMWACIQLYIIKLKMYNC